MVQPDLSHDKRGNEVKFLFSGGMTSLANGLASAQVVLPWVYALIGGPLYLVGLLIPTIRIGNLLAQLTIVPTLLTLKVRKWAYVIASTLIFTALILITAATMGLNVITAALIFFTSTVLLGACIGVASLTSQEVMAKTIRHDRIGRLLAIQASVGGGLTFLILIGMFYFYPDDGSAKHHLMFIYLAAIAWIAAGISFSLIKEQPSVSQVKRSVWTETRQGWKLYRSTPWFRRFFLTRALFLSVGLAIPFYSIHASFDTNAGTQSLSFFILATAVMNIFSGPIWSRMLSRDPCRVLVLSGFIAAVAGGVALIHDIVSGISFEVLYTIVFALAALASTGMTQASATYLALMTPEQDRPRYLAINSAMLGIIAVFISGAMGVLAHNIHIHWALGVLISVTLVASHSATKLKTPIVSAETEDLPTNIPDSDLC